MPVFSAMEYNSSAYNIQYTYSLLLAAGMQFCKFMGMVSVDSYTSVLYCTVCMYCSLQPSIFYVLQSHYVVNAGDDILTQKDDAILESLHSSQYVPVFTVSEYNCSAYNIGIYISTYSGKLT